MSIKWKMKAKLLVWCLAHGVFPSKIQLLFSDLNILQVLCWNSNIGALQIVIHKISIFWEVGEEISLLRSDFLNQLIELLPCIGIHPVVESFPFPLLVLDLSCLWPLTCCHDSVLYTDALGGEAEVSFFFFLMFFFFSGCTACLVGSQFPSGIEPEPSALRAQS